MAYADYISDKLTCLNAIIGIVLGLILAINHNDANLWITAVKFIIVISAIITIIPVVSGIYSREKMGEEFSLTRIIPIYLLIFGEIGVGTVLGIVVGSVIIGNFHIDGLRLR